MDYVPSGSNMSTDVQGREIEVVRKLPCESGHS